MASPSQGNSQGNSQAVQAVQGLQAQAGTFIPQPPRLELGAFENLAGKWRAWRRRWNAFAAVSGLNASGDEVYKTGMLVSVADDETLKIIDQLPYGSPPDRKKLNKVLELLEKHCLQDVNVLHERHRFNQRRQGEDEPIDKCVRDLRTLATTCEFVQDGKNFTEQMIRDRLVCGMTSARVQKRLLAKGDPALAECVKECRTTAATSCQAAEIHTTMSKVKQEPSEQETRDILYTQQAGPRRPSYSNSGLGTACKFCNRQRGKRNCPAFGQVCRSCGRRNHFAVV